VAQEFGDHPETAVIRMRWARSVVREAFADPAPGPGRGTGLSRRRPLPLAGRQAAVSEA